MISQRLAPVALEPRGVLADYNSERDQLDIWITTQRPHSFRHSIAGILGMPEDRVRVVAGDIGGGFGSKGPLYPDQVAVIFAARQLGRPVKWVEERSESFLATTHGRDQVADLEVAVEADGRITAIRGSVHASMGAYLYLNAAGTLLGRMAPLLPQSYRIRAIDVDVHGVFTNTTPIGPYRGAGRPEAAYYTERLIDLVAAELGLDPAEVRRRNYVTTFPYDTCTGLSYDSGDYQAALDLALQRIGYAGLRKEQARAREEGRLVGVGTCSFVELGGVTPPGPGPGAAPGTAEPPGDTATVTVDSEGKVTVAVGTSAHGQGHQTAFAQLAADTLGVPFDDVRVVFGDTGLAPFGFGTFGSRSAAVGGTAVVLACRDLLGKASEALGQPSGETPRDAASAAPGDAASAAPRIAAVTVAERRTLAEAATRLAGTGGLRASARAAPPGPTFASGSYACAVEIDPDTGRVTITRFVAVDDCGRVINPLLVDGQVHGGIAQGIGQALYEHMTYDEDGQPLSASLMDYAVPGAAQLPAIETDRVESPSPVNPLGVKGVGESGAIGATPAVVNAVIDALSPFGIRHLDMPLTPEKIWSAIRDAPQPPLLR
jgi:carbon-monoxide dehydrogenase large subunit